MKTQIRHILAWGREWYTVTLTCGHRHKLRKAEVARAQVFVGKQVRCTACPEGQE